jgi:hypothetical protein
LKYTLTSLLFFLFCHCSKSYETNWQSAFSGNGEWKSVKIYGGSNEDVAHSIIKTNDGGFAVIGNTKSNNGDLKFKTTEDSDILFIKFNSDEKIEFIETYGGSDDDRGYDLVQLEDQGYVLLGYSESSDGDASINKGQHDNWVIRIDSLGKIIWEKSFGFRGHDHAYNIISTSDGGFFFNGFLDITASSGSGSDGKRFQISQKHGVGEFWCHKIDENGILEWRRYYGGSNNDRSYDAIETSDGNFLLVGTSESNDFQISNPKGGYDMWIIKIDPKGNLLWERSFGGKNYDGAYSVIENSYGNYLVLGQSFSQDGDITNPLGSSDFLLINLNSEGIILNVENLGTSYFDSGRSISEVIDGTIFLLGHTNKQNKEDISKFNDVLLIQTLPNGSFYKRHTLGGSGTDIGYDFIQLDNGAIIIVGSSDSNDFMFSKSYGNEDVFIAKWD